VQGIYKTLYGSNIDYMFRQERWQKNFQVGVGCGKTRPKNSTIKPLSILSVSCMKIQGGSYGPPSPSSCWRLCVQMSFDLNIAFLVLIILM